MIDRQWYWYKYNYTHRGRVGAKRKRLKLAPNIALDLRPCSVFKERSSSPGAAAAASAPVYCIIISSWPTRVLLIGRKREWYWLACKWRWRWGARSSSYWCGSESIWGGCIHSLEVLLKLYSYTNYILVDGCKICIYFFWHCLPSGSFIYSLTPHINTVVVVRHSCWCTLANYNRDRLLIALVLYANHPKLCPRLPSEDDKIVRKYLSSLSHSTTICSVLLDKY